MLQSMGLFDVFFFSMIMGAGLLAGVYCAISFCRTKPAPMAKMNKRR